MPTEIQMAPQHPGCGPPAPVPILQIQEEFEQLLDLYRAREPQRVLEVGTYHGGTLFHWLRNAQPGATVVSVDNYRSGVDNRALYTDWCPLGVRLVDIEGDSHDDATVEFVAKNGPYDWVWIDAGHRYNEVKADWLLYSPLAINGAVVCFHDICAAHAGVAKLWSEIKRDHTTQEIIGTHVDGNRSWGIAPELQWGGIGVCHV